MSGARTEVDETTTFTPRWDARGLVPVIAQAPDGTVLMLAYANEEALRLTLQTNEAHYWSRSRERLWHKGATSGATQRVLGVFTDCDQDALIYRVEQSGAACHTGRASCFYRQLESDASERIKLAFTGCP